MPKTNFQNDIINRIRILRTENNISQIALADIIDVSNGQIGNIESRKYQHKYTLKHLYIIARYFNVTVEYLLTGSNEPLTTENLILILIKYEE